MQPISFHELIAAVGGTPVGLPALEQKFARVEIDSRSIRPGDLFWALQGKKQDGHKFVKQAFAAGAVAAVVERAQALRLPEPRIEVDDALAALWLFANWYRRQFETLVISVTGSVGKTTTRRVIAAVLSARFAGIESPLNFNNEFGVPLSLLQIEAQHEFAVIELAASSEGEIEALAAIAQPEVGAVTAVGPAHLDEFGSLEAIIRTKGELLAALPETGFAVINGDDKNVRQMAGRAPCQVILVGEKEHNHVRAEQVSVGNGRLEFTVDGTRFQLAAAGRHHITAALMAVAIGRQFDMTDAEIAQGLARFASAPGRSHPQQIGLWTVIDDTYNANPLSMSAACATLRDWQAAGKRILVTGDMLSLGDWGTDFHRLLGEEAARSRIDRLIAVGAQAVAVAGSARKQGMDAGCLGACRDQEIALMLLDCWLEPGDVVLVKGSRGMKMELLIAGLKRLADQRRQDEPPQRRAA
jgi:UDP-N-acetylmuramoyl-tripeptide--D-alanyl-D-alanine ligase